MYFFVESLVHYSVRYVSSFHIYVADGYLILTTNQTLSGLWLNGLNYYICNWGWSYQLVFGHDLPIPSLILCYIPQCWLNVHLTNEIMCSHQIQVTSYLIQILILVLKLLTHWQNRCHRCAMRPSPCFHYLVNSLWSYGLQRAHKANESLQRLFSLLVVYMVHN